MINLLKSLIKKYEEIREKKYEKIRELEEKECLEKELLERDKKLEECSKVLEEIANGSGKLEKIGLNSDISKTQIGIDYLVYGIMFAESYKDYKNYWLKEKLDYIKHKRDKVIEDFDLISKETTKENLNIFHKEEVLRKLKFKLSALEIFTSLDKFNETLDHKYAEIALSYLFFFGNNAEITGRWCILNELNKYDFRDLKSKNSRGVIEIGSNSNGLIDDAGGYENWINLDSYVMAGRLAQQLGSKKLSKKAFRRGYEIGDRLHNSISMLCGINERFGIKALNELYPHLAKRLAECASDAELENAEQVKEDYEKIRTEKLKEGYDLAKENRMNATKTSLSISF